MRRSSSRPSGPELWRALARPPGDVGAETIDVELSHPEGKGIDHPALALRMVEVQVDEMLPVEVMRRLVAGRAVEERKVGRVQPPCLGVTEAAVFRGDMVRHEVHDYPQAPGHGLRGPTRAGQLRCRSRHAGGRSR